jgi:hypothetical protein
MTQHTTPAQSSASLPWWRTFVTAVVMLAGAFTVTGLALPTVAQAATLVVDQCNGHGPGTAGATTALKCTVTVVNTIRGTDTSSTTTVSRLCTLGPCSTPNGTFTTHSGSLVTVVRQCNSSDNDAAHAISCSLRITNNITRNTPGARTVTRSTVSQCVGSGTGGGGALTCGPSPATTAGADITQCNGSGNGGGGAVHCTVDPSSNVSSAVPVTVSQCNGTGNVGGSAVTCEVSLMTNITNASVAAHPIARRTPTPSATPTATPAPSRSQVAQAAAAPPQGATASNGGSQWEVLLAIGAALTMAAAVGTLLFRRYGGEELVRRLTRKG